MRLRLGVLLLIPAVLAACTDNSTNPALEARVYNMLGGLAPGQVLDLAGNEAQTVYLKGGQGRVYLYVPFFASAKGSDSVHVSISATGVQGGSSTALDLAPSPRPLFGASASALRPQPDLAFHDRLRRSERELGRRLHAGARPDLVPAPRTQATRGVPSIGDTIILNTNAEDGCTNPHWVSAKVRDVSTHAIIAVDPNNPGPGFTDAQLHEIAAAFDTLVWKVDTNAFGDPSDIDGNQHVIIFYTRSVNELTPPDTDFYVGGFFYGRDLFPRVGNASFEACPTSNQGEMFYMLAPDPNGDINGNRRSVGFVDSATISTTGHEFEHLINASHRLFVTRSPDLEETWLDEGLAHIAEELLFYESSGLHPRQNITVDMIRGSQRTVDAFNLFSSGNFGRYESYLDAPSKESLLGVDTELETRGAIWAFLRYAADNRTDDATAFFHDLVNSTTTGLGNLQQVLATDPVDLMQSWTVSVYTDDFVDTGDEAYTQPSWDFRSLLTFFNNGHFPLKVESLSPNSASTFTLKGGGAAFALAFSLPDQPATIQTLSSTSPPSGDSLRVSVVRVK
jgi:hypothetical protein